MNKQQIIKQQANIKLVKGLVTKHHTKSPKRILVYLVEEYKVAISERTIKRYLAVIKKEKNKQIAKKQKTAQVKQVKEHGGEITYPYFIKDPSGKEHKITGDNMTITISWGASGRLITYDTQACIWCYDNNGKPFDKDKIEKPWHKSRSRNSFEYDIL